MVTKRLQELLACERCLLFDEESGLCHYDPTPVPTTPKNFCAHAAIVMAGLQDVEKIEDLNRMFAPEVWDGDDEVQ